MVAVEGVAATRARRLRWLNLRTVLGATLFSIAVLSGWTVMSSPTGKIRLLAATAAMPQGSRLEPRDLEVVEVDLPPTRAELYLGAGASVEGWALLRPVGPGELLPAASVTDSPDVAPGRSITIPLEADHAVGGALVPGDRVDVFASLGSKQGSARTSLLVGGAEVEAVVTGAGLVNESSLTGITVSVSPLDAAKIAFAIRNADLDVARLEGSHSAPAMGAVTERDLR